MPEGLGSEQAAEQAWLEGLEERPPEEQEGAEIAGGAEEEEERQRRRRRGVVVELLAAARGHTWRLRGRRQRQACSAREALGSAAAAARWLRSA